MTRIQSTNQRPALGDGDPDEAVRLLLGHLQRGLDDGDADHYDARFAADVLWGTPYGETVDNHADLNRAHRSMMSRPGTLPSRYEPVNAVAAGPDVVVTQIRRRSLAADETVPFDEMAMYVLVRRDGQWWLVGGQNTPIRPKPQP